MVASCSQSHPLSGCPQLPVVPPASPGAAWRHSPSLQRSDPGHGRFSPTSLGAAIHTALPHIGAPVGAAAHHPHPRELLQPPPNSQKLGLCLQSAIPGLSHVRYKLWLLTADYVFKSALVEQQAGEAPAPEQWWLSFGFPAGWDGQGAILTRHLPKEAGG